MRDCKGGITVRKYKSDQRKKKSLLAQLGPGLITGASDDDPSGIATYSQAGAGFGYGLLWIMLVSLPLMGAIQEISARIGRTTGRGIAGNLLRHYPAWVLYPLILLLVFTNIINLGADIGAMGDAMSLVVGGPALLYAAVLTIVSLLLQVFMSYARYAKCLKWLTLVLFSYVAVVFMIHVPWWQAVRGTLVPSISWNQKYWATIIAVLGTTISPYLFFWQASQETEEIKANSAEHSLLKSPNQAKVELKRIRLDTYVGMALSNSVAFFIILSAAVTLHASGVTDIETSAQAAEALRPLAGPATFVLFALGIVGTGLLALPVLAGSAAYAVGGAIRLRMGLGRKPNDAKAFYGVLAAATLLGLAINLPFVQRGFHVTPIKALFWAAIINGLVAVPIMVVIMQMVSNPKVMGKFAYTGYWMRVMGWLATAVMAVAAVGMVLTWKK